MFQVSWINLDNTWFSVVKNFYFYSRLIMGVKYGNNSFLVLSALIFRIISYNIYPISVVYINSFIGRVCPINCLTSIHCSSTSLWEFIDELLSESISFPNLSISVLLLIEFLSKNDEFFFYRFNFSCSSFSKISHY